MKPGLHKCVDAPKPCWLAAFQRFRCLGFGFWVQGLGLRIYAIVILRKDGIAKSSWLPAGTRTGIPFPMIHSAIHTTTCLWEVLRPLHRGLDGREHSVSGVDECQDAKDHRHLAPVDSLRGCTSSKPASTCYCCLKLALRNLEHLTREMPFCLQQCLFPWKRTNAAPTRLSPGEESLWPPSTSGRTGHRF